MIKVSYFRHDLVFRFPAKTSRAVLYNKPSWIIEVSDDKQPGISGTGECPLIPGLHPENEDMVEKELECLCANPPALHADPGKRFSRLASVNFGFETAIRDLQSGGKKVMYPSCFTAGEEGIRINGLVWMGDPEFMKKQVREKIEKGFRCLKIKVGALDFNAELEFLRFIRDEYRTENPEIRLDANGSFPPVKAAEIMKRLSEFSIHSIEQPLKPGNMESMAELCRQNIIPIALDEELIGVMDPASRVQLIHTIRPRYLILKPGLLGSIESCLEWIRIAEMAHAGWWVTSALESNIGLNVIAQWTYTLENRLPQGLGTGGLYTNNFNSPLYLSGEVLRYDPEGTWDINPLTFAV